MADLSELYRQLAYYRSGGKQTGERDIDKINAILQSTGELGKTFSQLANERLARKKAMIEMERAKAEIPRLQAVTEEAGLRNIEKMRELTPARFIVGQSPEQTQSLVKGVESQPIPSEDLISGTLASRGRGLEDISNKIKSEQEQYGDATIKELEKLSSAGFKNEQAQSMAEKRAKVLSGMSAPQQNAAFKLVDDYEKASGDFPKIVASYNRVRASAEDPSAAGDLALIFNYMKILDPGSVVREGEFATAQNSGSIPDVLAARYNKVLRGERLSDSIRKDFLDRSKRLYQSSLKQQKMVDKIFEERSSRFGIDPNIVVRDMSAYPDVVIDKDSSAPIRQPITAKSKTSPYKTAEEVRDAYETRKIDKKTASNILKLYFRMK